MYLILFGMDSGANACSWRHTITVKHSDSNDGDKTTNIEVSVMCKMSISHRASDSEVQVLKW